MKLKSDRKAYFSLPFFSSCFAIRPLIVSISCATILVSLIALKAIRHGIFFSSTHANIFKKFSSLYTFDASFFAFGSFQLPVMFGFVDVSVAPSQTYAAEISISRSSKTSRWYGYGFFSSQEYIPRRTHDIICQFLTFLNLEPLVQIPIFNPRLCACSIALSNSGCKVGSPPPVNSIPRTPRSANWSIADFICSSVNISFIARLAKQQNEHVKLHGLHGDI